MERNTIIEENPNRKDVNRALKKEKPKILNTIPSNSGKIEFGSPVPINLLINHPPLEKLYAELAYQASSS
jgi:hypothetical protein